MWITRRKSFVFATATHWSDDPSAASRSLTLTDMVPGAVVGSLGCFSFFPAVATPYKPDKPHPLAMSSRKRARAADAAPTAAHEDGAAVHDGDAAQDGEVVAPAALALVRGRAGRGKQAPTAAKEGASPASNKRVALGSTAPVPAAAAAHEVDEEVEDHHEEEEEEEEEAEEEEGLGSGTPARAGAGAGAGSTTPGVCTVHLG
jgi:hypothetical protein